MKFQEVEILLQENDGLQMKLQSQEEDFRLQNEALMRELSQVSITDLNYLCQISGYHIHIYLNNTYTHTHTHTHTHMD